jgi:hypothetical protein
MRQTMKNQPTNDDNRTLTTEEIAQEIAAERAERNALCLKLWGVSYTRELGEALENVKTDNLIDRALF